MLAGHADAVRRLHDPADDVPQLDRGAQPLRDRPRQRVVTAANPEHAIDRRPGARSGLGARRQLIDQRDQRQLLGVGEEEAAQPAQPGFEGVARSLGRQPLRDRLPRERSSDRRVPSPLRDGVIGDLALEPPA